MSHELPAPEEATPKQRAFQFAMGVVVVAQLVAFWLLCSHQVRQAEVRSAETQMAQTAMADCLQYIPGSTIASCAARLAGNPANTQTADAARATRVGFTNFR